MTKVYQDLSKAGQMPNHLQDIDPLDYKEYDWETLILEALNLLSNEKPIVNGHRQTVPETIGVLSAIDPQLSLSQNTLKNYFSPGKDRYFPPILIIPKLTVACRSDAFFRAILAVFNLHLINDTDKKVLDLIKHRIEETKITNHRPEILQTIAQMYDDAAGIEIEGKETIQ